MKVLWSIIHPGLQMEFNSATSTDRLRGLLEICLRGSETAPGPEANNTVGTTHAAADVERGTRQGRQGLPHSLNSLYTLVPTKGRSLRECKPDGHSGMT